MKNYGDYYNRREIGQKVCNYHSNGMSDEEIIEQIGEETRYAEKVEHEFYIHGRNTN